MTTKYGRTLVLAGVLSISALSLAPSYAEESATATTIPVVATVPTGVIHVISSVVNDGLGTKSPSDFTFTLKHHAVDVPGSPFVGNGNVGTTFIVPAGTYVVTADPVVGYIGTWFNGEVTTGFIDLKAGQVVTIVRMSVDISDSYDVVVVDIPVTENGAVLPDTATPMYNYLLAGSFFAVAGALGLRRSITFSKAK